jgi:hypothetical protein
MTSPTAGVAPAPQLMPPSICLVMTLLTCLRLRMPVSPVDVARWAADDALPYHDLEVRAGLYVWGGGG